MKSVGAYQAKTHLSGLLDEVSRGASISITRKGVPVAMMVPPPLPEERGRWRNDPEAQRVPERDHLGRDIGPRTHRRGAPLLSRFVLDCSRFPTFS